MREPTAPRPLTRLLARRSSTAMSSRPCYRVSVQAVMPNKFDLAPQLQWLMTLDCDDVRAKQLIARHSTMHRAGRLTIPHCISSPCLRHCWAVLVASLPCCHLQQHNTRCAWCDKCWLPHKAGCEPGCTRTQDIGGNLARPPSEEVDEAGSCRCPSLASRRCCCSRVGCLSCCCLR